MYAHDKNLSSVNRLFKGLHEDLVELHIVTTNFENIYSVLLDTEKSLKNLLYYLDKNYCGKFGLNKKTMKLIKIGLFKNTNCDYTTTGYCNQCERYKQKRKGTAEIICDGGVRMPTVEMIETMLDEQLLEKTRKRYLFVDGYRIDWDESVNDMLSEYIQAEFVYLFNTDFYKDSDDVYYRMYFQSFLNKLL